MVTLDMIRKPVEGDLEAEIHVFGQNVVPDHDRVARLPAGIDRSPAPAHVRFVDHVVVDERGHVDHLDQRGCEQRAQPAAALPRRSVERRRQQHRHRTNPLAPRRERIIEHLGEQRAVRREFLPDELLEGLQIALDLVTHVCGAIATLCEGEILQNDKANRQEMTRASYLDIIYKKTACLIGVSASAGALAVGASREKQALMRKFGESIGMAFQIQDDILDYTRTARTGKPSNNDLREHKVTLPLLTVLESVGEERRRELQARLARCHEEDESVEYLQHIVENEGGMEKAARVMQEYLARAMSVLSEYEPSEYRDALANLCVYVGERDR